MPKTIKLSEKLPVDKKITLIIGSGFHNYALNSNNSILTNWNLLLQSVFPSSENHFDNYILEFEKRLVEKTSQQNVNAADEIEKKCLEKLTKTIKVEQSKLIKQKKYNFPFFLFNSSIIDNVISLNYDLIPELILNGGKKPKVIQSCDKENIRKNSNSCRHRIVNGINFWHPHGDIENCDSLILGLRHYAQHLKDIENMRTLSKSEAEQKGKIRTWYDAILNNPVLIIGAGLSDSEWDIWTVLVNRKRNFAKKKNKKKYRFGVYMMKSDCQNNKPNNHNNWIKPIFEKKYCFDKQWEMLESMFKNNDRTFLLQ
jgi:hypothetical protein